MNVKYILAVIFFVIGAIVFLNGNFDYSLIWIWLAFVFALTGIENTNIKRKISKYATILFLFLFVISLFTIYYLNFILLCFAIPSGIVWFLNKSKIK